MDSHLDVFTKNHEFAVSSSEDIKLSANIQDGGFTDDNDNNIATGGFLPIYIVDDTIEDKDGNSELNKNREFQTIKTAVSIKDILSKIKN